MRYYIIAGEASGDMHAANLMKAISRNDPAAVFRCWGGDQMEKAGAVVVKHYRELSFMGFIEVIANLPTILKNIRFCKEDILNFKPDALILVDYPGFNLRIAAFARKQGLKVIYYISPQVWAWKKSRVYSIRRNVDKMIVILPFEKDFYEGYDYPVDFVGHPLLDVLNGTDVSGGTDNFSKANGLTATPIIALLPGSRKQEIKKMLPLMVSMQKKFPQYEFIIAGAPSVEPSYYHLFTQQDNPKILFGQTHELLRHAHGALVTSGTATLETALLKVPQVVCYKGSPISYAIARRIVDVKFISLVNLIMDRQVVTELIQHDFNEKRLEEELHLILESGHRQQILADYDTLRQKLGGSGASQRAAKIVDTLLKS
jgi:lipid-A-disaccharide synthase